MLVGFIGSPCSGKTTTAAKLFAELKDCGQPTEYIAERARWYIANKKFGLRAQNQEHLFNLTDEDQIAIASSQYRAELVMNQRGIVVVTDSCVLNSLLYMTPGVRESEAVQRIAAEAIDKYDVLFVCAPVPRPQGVDPNRVHDEAASMHIHEQIHSILLPKLEGREVHFLTGSTHSRMGDAFSVVMKKFGDL